MRIGNAHHIPQAHNSRHYSTDVRPTKRNQHNLLLPPQHPRRRRLRQPQVPPLHGRQRAPLYRCHSRDMVARRPLGPQAPPHTRRRRHGHPTRCRLRLHRSESGHPHQGIRPIRVRDAVQHRLRLHLGSHALAPPSRNLPSARKKQGHGARHDVELDVQLHHRHGESGCVCRYSRVFLPDYRGLLLVLSGPGAFLLCRDGGVHAGGDRDGVWGSRVYG